VRITQAAMRGVLYLQALYTLVFIKSTVFAAIAAKTVDFTQAEMGGISTPIASVALSPQEYFLFSNSLRS
jgi:hypothetical protein